MMRCDNCGTLLGPADAFCDNCGTPSGTAGNGNETRDARTAGIPSAAYQTVPPQRDMGWPRTFFAHGEARRPGRTSSATRYLSAAAYLNPGYAGLVIRELINSQRAVAPSVGMDLGPIVRHCLRARRIQLTRDIVLSVLLLAELILSPVLTVCIIIAGFFLGYLPSANWARRSRGTKILAGIGAGLLLLGLLAVVIFIAIIGAVVSYLHGLGSASSPGLGTIGQSAPSGGITPRGVVELLLLAAMFATQVAYLHVRSRTLIEELAPDAGVLGLFDSASFESRAVHLDKGEILVVYSDGLTDAENQREEMFGKKRLLHLIRQEAPAGSHALERKLLKAIAEFTQGTPQTDDITFVVVEKCQ